MARCLQHSEKTMEDFFTNKDPDFLRPSLQFSDSDYCYTSLFSPEIRIYRTSKKLEVVSSLQYKIFCSQNFSSVGIEYFRIVFLR